MSGQIILILLCMLGAAFFSGIENGIISIRRVRLRHLAKEGDINAQLLEHFIQHPDKFLGTTLVGTNICVVIASVLATGVAESLMESGGEATSTVVMSLLLLIFSEYIPKSWFQARPLERSNMFAGILHMTAGLLRPISYVVTSITSVIVPGGSAENKDNLKFLRTREELKALTAESEKSGVLSSKESLMIHRVFELERKRAKSIMIPRSQMVCIDSNATVSTFFKIVRESNYTRVPLIGDDGKFNGIINIFDVLSTEKVGSTNRIVDFTRPSIFIKGDTPVDDILPKLRRARQPMCFVTDDAGEVVGLITTEDVLEEIVGQL